MKNFLKQKIKIIINGEIITARTNNTQYIILLNKDFDLKRLSIKSVRCKNIDKFG